MLSHFCLVFLPTTFASLPPGVMFLNRSTTPRDSATDIEKTSQKGVLEREQPNRSVVMSLTVIKVIRRKSMQNFVSLKFLGSGTFKQNGWTQVLRMTKNLEKKIYILNITSTNWKKLTSIETTLQGQYMLLTEKIVDHNKTPHPFPQ